VASLGKAQYYGHPQNHFWRLVGAVIGEPLPEMDYELRLRTLLEHHIGLWDVIGACSRKGSLDSDIRSPRHNDFGRVTRIAKKLRRVCFNGKTAGRMEPLFVEWGYETIVLPSSSPANTVRFEEKLKQWRTIRAC
jgi:hypoxanthine-DNA glycosylase